jgi:hypothetical protein
MKHLIALGRKLFMSALMVSIAFGIPLGTFAAVSDWQQGVSILPQSSGEFGSDAFKQSVQNAKNTGADYITLVIPYSQSNIYSTDVHATWKYSYRRLIKISY